LLAADVTVSGAGTFHGDKDRAARDMKFTLAIGVMSGNPEIKIAAVVTCARQRKNNGRVIGDLSGGREIYGCGYVPAASSGIGPVKRDTQFGVQHAYGTSNFNA